MYNFLTLSSFLATQTNTFEGIVITDGATSYAVFLYECGSIQWDGRAVIGFKANGSFYQNHVLSGQSAASIDCVNSPASQVNNVVYRLNQGTTLYTIAYCLTSSCT